MGTSKKQKKRDGLRYREFVLSPYGVIKIKSLGYSNELIDQLLQDCHSPQDLLGESGLLKVLTKRLAERVLEAEMEMHLGYAKHDPAGNHSGNSRNGKTSKSVRSQNGEIELDIPRDRNSIANRLKNDYILCPDMRQRSIAGCYQNNVAWLYLRADTDRWLC